MKKFILYGFLEDEILKMKNILKFVSNNIKYITFDDDDFDKTLGEVIENEKFNMDGKYNRFDKVIIFQNIVSKEIDVYLKILKKKLSKNIIFATTTQTSIDMQISYLFDEFKQERDYFRKNK